MTELDENLLNIMSNSFIMQAYVQVFDCIYITFKNSVKLFELMEIAEYFYRGVVEPSHKITNRADSNYSGHIRLKIVEAASSNTYSGMLERDGKCREIYVDHPKDRSKPTYLIRGPGHSSYECKVLGDFGSNYAKIRPTKDRGHNLSNRNKLNRPQENNDVFNSIVD